MATRTSAGGACSGTLPATGHACGVTRRDRVLRALFCVLLGFCAGCTTSADQAKAMPGSSQASLRSREPVPLTARTLLLKPVDRGRLTSGYGTRYHPFSKRRQRHQGIDWAAPRGTPVRAAGDGVVVAAGRLSSYGYYLRIDHGRTIETAYAHLDRYASKLRPGRIVHQGDEVGRVGRTGRATGPHLHYEILVAGRPIDPLGFAPPPQRFPRSILQMRHQRAPGANSGSAARTLLWRRKPATLLCVMTTSGLCRSRRSTARR